MTYTGAAIIFPSSSWIVLTTLSGPRSRPKTPGIEAGLWVCSQELWPLDHKDGHRERERKLGGGSEGHYRVGGRGLIETEFGSLEGSQAVPASPSGKGEALTRDLLNFYF
jgi:hypothetical protein